MDAELVGDEAAGMAGWRRADNSRAEMRVMADDMRRGEVRQTAQ